MLLSVACPAVLYSSTLSPKRHDFYKDKVIEDKMCVFVFSTKQSETFLRKSERDLITNGFHVKCPLFLSDFDQT